MWRYKELNVFNPNRMSVTTQHNGMCRLISSNLRASRGRVRPCWLGLMLQTYFHMTGWYRLNLRGLCDPLSPNTSSTVHCAAFHTWQHLMSCLSHNPERPEGGDTTGGLEPPGSGDEAELWWIRNNKTIWLLGHLSLKKKEKVRHIWHPNNTGSHVRVWIAVIRARICQWNRLVCQKVPLQII